MVPSLIVASAQEWWDSCPDAGPTKRPSVEYSEAKPALKVLAIDNDKVKLFVCNMMLVSKQITVTNLMYVRWSPILIHTPGPPKLRLPEAVSQTLHGKADVLQSKLDCWNSKHSLTLLQPGTGAASGTPATTSGKRTVGSRTLCRPVYADGEFLNYRATRVPATVTTNAEFEANKTRSVCNQCCMLVFVFARWFAG